MFIDSHCHLNFPELRAQLETIQSAMQASQVNHALCISVDLETFPQVLEVALTNPRWYATVGVHPDYEETEEPTVERLVELAQHPKVIGIGETGLDYFRLQGDLSWQRQRFITHIEAAKTVRKPLIVHTRQAAEDTLRILKEHHASEVGGVMHCFTESLEVAKQAIDLGFYISFSGIVTFKNAQALKDTVRALPLDRLLIETDSPYLAPVPYRGQLNNPSLVVHVAEEIARLKNVTLEEVARLTTSNFFTLFNVIDTI